jgi:hypothetical protein
MGTMHTPPIDLYEESGEQANEPIRDDREMGFVFPADNGDREEDHIADGEERLHAILGW